MWNTIYSTKIFPHHYIFPAFNQFRKVTMRTAIFTKTRIVIGLWFSLTRLSAFKNMRRNDGFLSYFCWHKACSSITRSVKISFLTFSFAYKTSLSCYFGDRENFSWLRPHRRGWRLWAKQSLQQWFKVDRGTASYQI